MQDILVGLDYIYLSNYNKLVNTEFKELFLKYKENQDMKVQPVEVGVKEIKNHLVNLSQISLEITQDCNLRCKYCPFSEGGDFKFHRSRESKFLDFKTAIEGLNYVYSIIKDRYKKNFTISYYGGEPLLKFNTIRKIVKYSQKLFRGWKLNSTITSNGTLLSDEVIRFLIANNFTLLISLDGPKKNHDAKRIYHDGRGSFDDVMRNIEKIKSVDNEYFLNKVLFSVVCSKDLSLESLFNFFSQNSIVNRNNIRFNFVNALDSNYYKLNPIDKTSFNNGFSSVLLTVKEKLEVKQLIRPIEREFCYTEFAELYSRGYTQLAGACFFSSRLFLDAFGNFHICERINNSFPIGNVKDGLDFSRMEKILLSFIEITTMYCSKCNIRSLCSPCYIYFAKNNKFQYDEELCDLKRKDINKKLSIHVEQNLARSRAREESTKSKEKKFHQMVVLERGPANTAVIDLLKGNLYHVDNNTIKNFCEKKYDKIIPFIEFARSEELLLELKGGSWVPDFQAGDQFRSFNEALSNELSFQLDLGKGVNPEVVREKIKIAKISHINYYGDDNINHFFAGIKVIYLKKNVDDCYRKSNINKSFGSVREESYLFNKRFNSCWGKRIAITKDGKIRPCIYSNFELGDLNKDDFYKAVESAQSFWGLTKDKIDVCKVCEFRYICFDCRELAVKCGSGLYGKNPNCKYDPNLGVWG